MLNTSSDPNGFLSVFVPQSRTEGRSVNPERGSGASSSLMGIICPLDENRVNVFDKMLSFSNGLVGLANSVR